MVYWSLRMRPLRGRCNFFGNELNSHCFEQYGRWYVVFTFKWACFHVITHNIIYSVLTYYQHQLFFSILVTFCASEYPNANIVRGKGSSKSFTLHCSDNVTNHEITCSDGRWTGGFLPEMCPNVTGEPARINTTIRAGERLYFCRLFEVKLPN